MLTGHFTLGRLTVYGNNAMHFGVTFWTKRWGYICFRLPLPSHGRWWPLYFYTSPNATPWASTFMIGKVYDRGEWNKSRLRRKALGHNWNTDDPLQYAIMRNINEGYGDA